MGNFTTADETETVTAHEVINSNTTADKIGNRQDSVMKTIHTE